MQPLTLAPGAGYVRHGSLSVPRRAERAYAEAKAYLTRDRIERSLFDRLEHARGRRFRLTINHRNDDHFDPRTDTIAWDPHSALRTTGGGRQSPALGLGHEIDHAVESPARERRLALRSCRHYDDAEEKRVITGSERHAARTLGEGVRYDHSGTTYWVAAPEATRPRNALQRVECGLDARIDGLRHPARASARPPV